VRLDPRGQSGGVTLQAVKSFLAGGFASVFGFSVCTAPSQDGEIPYPTIFDGVRGGEAAVAVGYDDARRIRSHRGAILIASSRGVQWGDQGFGWLPYAYVEEHLALDFWTLVSPEWLLSGEFRRPAQRPQPSPDRPQRLT
jgi:C1A family cysteine protease